MRVEWCLDFRVYCLAFGFEVFGFRVLGSGNEIANLPVTIVLEERSQKEGAMTQGDVRWFR